MAELLAIHKAILLAGGVKPTAAIFYGPRVRRPKHGLGSQGIGAWGRAWDVMVEESAWKHKTIQRRDARYGMEETITEWCAAFVGAPSPFSFVAERLSTAASSMCLRLEPWQLGRAMIAAVNYVEIEDPHRALAASAAARKFTALEVAA